MSAPEQSAAIGRLGRYPLMAVLGTGSMGVVYRSVDPSTGHPIALKALRPDLLDPSIAMEFAARLRTESDAARSLSHPAIIAVHEHGTTGGGCYLTMECVNASCLKARLDTGAVFDLSRTISILAQLLEALQHAHEHGVWHRDVKPSNLLLTREDRLKLIDFGIAHIGSPASRQPEAVMGTPGYIAPENYRGEAFDHRGDLFAAGAILYLLLAGVPPYVGTPDEIMRQVCRETPKPPSVVGSSPGVGPLDTVVARALAVNPGKRFASAAQFRAALLQAYASTTGHHRHSGVSLNQSTEAWMGNNKKVLLVEDHDLVRYGTSLLLQSLGDVSCDISACRSLDDARTACRDKGPFDLMLLDLNLPDAKGLQGLRTMLDEFPKIPIAMLTGTQDEFIVRQAQSMGAVGYLLKSWTPERLKEALRSLLQPPSKPSAAAITERFPRLAGSSHYDRVAELGPRHLQVLELVLEGCSNQEISKATELSLGTVKNYVSAILLALDVDSRSHLISLFH